MENKNKITLIFLLVTIILSSLIIYILSNHIKQSKTLVKDIVKEKAIGYFNNIISTRHWNASFGGVYVKSKDGLKPNKYLEDNHTFTKDGELLIKINPAWMTRQISEISNKTDKNYFKITSLNPLNPLNKADKFESRALHFFEKNKKEKFFAEMAEDFSQFNFMGSLSVTRDCLKCHVNQAYKEGDIRGGIRISIPTTTYFEKLADLEEEHNYLIWAILFTALVIFAIFIWFLNKFFSDKDTIRKSYEDIKNLQIINEEFLSRYQYAIEGTRDGIWDWNLITDEVYFSENWKKILGYNNDEISNHIYEWSSRIHAEDKEEAYNSIKDNNNKITKYYQNVHRLQHKDGSWIWILDRGRTYFDDEGNPIRMVGFLSNITELKNLEITLEDTKQELKQLKMVIENASISIIITNIDANITYVNSSFCDVSGYSKKELIGQNTRILKYGEDDKSKYEDLWKTIISKNIWGGIFRNKRKDGSDYWVTATILPVLDKEKKVLNYLGIMREITKELYLEKQLKEKEELMLVQSKNAAMGEMISMIAHQWRQPITTISMSANNIIADIELEIFDEEETKKIAENISEQTQFLSKTIDDFRNFFKTDKDIDEVQIKSLFNELSSIIIASLKNHNILFNVVCEDKIIVKTYKRELLQVLLNIIKNAKEALDEKEIEGKFINVFVQELDNEIKLTINDNAGGIPKNIIDKIFDAYFTTKEDCNGTGLGLYMSKMIVEKHLLGNMSVRNTDVGAEFILVLHDIKNK